MLKYIPHENKIIYNGNELKFRHDGYIYNLHKLDESEINKLYKRAKEEFLVYDLIENKKFDFIKNHLFHYISLFLLIEELEGFSYLKINKNKKKISESLDRIINSIETCESNRQYLKYISYKIYYLAPMPEFSSYFHFQEEYQKENYLNEFIKYKNLTNDRDSNNIYKYYQLFLNNKNKYNINKSDKNLFYLAKKIVENSLAKNCYSIEYFHYELQDEIKLIRKLLVDERNKKFGIFNKIETKYSKLIEKEDLTKDEWFFLVAKVFNQRKHKKQYILLKEQNLRKLTNKDKLFLLKMVKKRRWIERFFSKMSELKFAYFLKSLPKNQELFDLVLSLGNYGFQRKYIYSHVILTNYFIEFIDPSSIRFHSPFVKLLPKRIKKVVYSKDKNKKYIHDSFFYKSHQEKESFLLDIISQDIYLCRNEKIIFKSHVKNIKRINEIFYKKIKDKRYSKSTYFLIQNYSISKENKKSF